MEKRSPVGGRHNRKILITGPESTGKTELANYLADYFGGDLVQEYAREYVEKLNRHYTYEDVVKIAERQRVDYHRKRETDRQVFFDTWLIITKVWFEVVYKRPPVWIEEELANASFDLVLVCSPDLPWEPDPVRENGGEQRNLLFKRYITEIEKLGWNYVIVEGTGKARYERAIELMRLIQE
jgi:NadR type nicotinamide-nucleotide adenylyltransferase